MKSEELEWDETPVGVLKREVQSLSERAWDRVGAVYWELLQYEGICNVLYRLCDVLERSAWHEPEEDVYLLQSLVQY